MHVVHGDPIVRKKIGALCLSLEKQRPSGSPFGRLQSLAPCDDVAGCTCAMCWPA